MAGELGLLQCKIFLLTLNSAGNMTAARDFAMVKQRPAKKARVIDGNVSHEQEKSKAVKNLVNDKPHATASKKINGKGKETKRFISSPSIHLPQDTQPDQLAESFIVIAGSYEKLLYGLEGKFVDESGKPSLIPTLTPVFIFPAHVSSVKAVAASPSGGKWLATGSSDEIIKVWDLRRRKEVGGLIQHEGSITYLDFPSRSYLVSASEDGTICLFRSRDWVLLRTLKGHKGRVNCVAVHPSGKLALSVGKDRVLRMWDLMRGKGSASTKLGKEGEVVRWSTKGDKFVVQSMSAIDIYSTSMTLLHTITHSSRIHNVKFCKTVDGGREYLLVAAEDKLVTVYAVSGESNTSLPVVATLTGHQNRVKSLDFLRVKLPEVLEAPRTSTILISTISSDGKIRIFDLASIPDVEANAKPVEITPLNEYDTKGSRLTCCTIAEGERTPRAGKRKLDEESDSDEGEGVPDNDSDGFSGLEESDNGDNYDDNGNDDNAE